MSIRTRVAVALLAACLVPLLAAVAMATWLLPRAGRAGQEQRLQTAAVAAAADLADGCERAGDRAALLATRLQLAAAVAAVTGADPVAAVRAESEPAVDAVAARVPGGTAGAVPPDGPAVQAGAVAGVALGSGEISCAPDTGTQRGRGTDGWIVDGLVGQSVPVTLGGRTLVRAVVAVPADGLLRDALAASGLPEGSGLAVVDASRPADGILAATDTSLSSGDLPVALVSAARSATTTAALPGGADTVVTGTADGRDYAVRTLPGAPPAGTSTVRRMAVVVAVDARPAPASALAAPAAVLVLAIALAAAAVVLLASALTRPVVQLSAVAGRLPARRGTGVETLAALSGLAGGAPDREVRRVSVALGDLARGLQHSEAHLTRARAGAIGAFDRFGSALDEQSRQDGLLRAVADAALLAADARLAVVTSMAGPEDLALARSGHDRATPAQRTVAVFLPAGTRGDTAAGSSEVVLDGDPSAIDLSDAGDLQSATTGMRLLRDLAAHAVTTGRAVSAELPDEGSGVVVPMRAPGPGRETVGYVAVARDRAEPSFDADALSMLSDLAGAAATAVASVRRHHRTTRLSVTDPLTGVGNVRHLTATLSREVERAQRFGHELGVVMVDVDHFKAVNDLHGHPRGDLVLVELAGRLLRCVRDIDTVARYGGEEFCILLPETGAAGAGVLARRVLAAVADRPFQAPGGADLSITVSVGVAAFPVHGRGGEAVLRAADQALYAAKRGGRNQVAVAPTVAGVEITVPRQADAADDAVSAAPPVVGHLG